MLDVLVFPFTLISFSWNISAEAFISLVWKLFLRKVLKQMDKPNESAGFIKNQT